MIENEMLKVNRQIRDIMMQGVALGIDKSTRYVVKEANSARSFDLTVGSNRGTGIAYSGWYTEMETGVDTQIK